MKASKRIFGLDLLRAFAILTVVYGHSLRLLPDTMPKDILKAFSFDGVTIFFVLSGFLIGRILLRTVDHDEFDGRMLLQFWIRRWFRTLPNYYFVLILLIIITSHLKNPLFPVPDNIISYFAFAQNIAWLHPKFFGEAWSLAVEEWFYLLIPLPLYLATKYKKINRKNLMLIYIASVIILSTIIRFYYTDFMDITIYDEWNYNMRMQVFTRMDSLMIGVFAAYLSLYCQDFWRSRIANYIFFLGLSLLIIDQLLVQDKTNLFYLNYIHLSLAPVATFFLLPKLSNWKAATGTFVNIVTFISLISYSMYLLNQAPIAETILPLIMPKIMYYLWQFTEYTHYIRYVLFWSGTILGAFVLYRYFEKPMMNLREKFVLDRKTIAHVN